MRFQYWMLACGVVFMATSAIAQPAKPDPSSKAARCAGKHGPEQGCTGFTPSTLRLRAEPKPAAKPDAPHAPDLGKDFVEHLRKGPPLQKQSERLLIVEIARLERLLAVTPKKSPDRAQLLRRIADDYAELEARAIERQLYAEEMARKADQERKLKPAH